jgi:hypothetical protein
MGSYSFKSVGKTTSEAKDQTLKKTSVPIGIVTPLRYGSNEGLFAMTYSLQDQIQYNLHDLLMTNWGERLGLYDFGANLKPVCADYNSQDDFDAECIKRISDAVSKWMSYVQLQDYVSSTNVSDASQQPSIVSILITYSVAALNVTNKTLELTLRVL